MTAFRIRLRDHSTVTIAADEVTTRGSGDLWLLRAAGGQKRASLPKLEPLVILARGEWTAVWPADAPSPFAPPEPQTKQPTDVRDASVSRRAVIAERLASLDGEEH